MRRPSKLNCSSQVCWRQVNLQVLWLQKKEEDDEFDGCLECRNDKIWRERERERVDLIRERHVRVKEEAKIASRVTVTGMISLLRDKFVRSENLRRY